MLVLRHLARAAHGIGDDLVYVQLFLFQVIIRALQLAQIQ